MGKGAHGDRNRFGIASGQAISSKGDCNVPHLLIKR
jgi:hypothetical protein